MDLWLPPKPAIIIPADKPRDASPVDLAIMQAGLAFLRAKPAGGGAASKWYFTVTITGTPSAFNGIGVGLGASGANVDFALFGDGWGIMTEGGSQWTIYNNGSGGSPIAVSNAAGQVINVAFEAPGSLYIGIGGTYYNSSGASTGSTPTTPTITGLTGLKFPFCLTTEPGDGLVLNPNPAGTPAGYTNWGAGTTWSPTNKSSTVNLSNGNLTADSNTTHGTGGALGTTSH